MARVRDPELTFDKERILVAGYVFLRFVLPAVVAPEANGVLDCQITPDFRNGLTLVCLLLPHPSKYIPSSCLHVP